MSPLDPFALGGRDADDAILPLFRQWIEAARATTEPATALTTKKPRRNDGMTSKIDRCDSPAMGRPVWR